MTARALLLVGGMVLAGCAGNPPQVSTQAIHARQYRPLYDAALSTLRDYGFDLERQDYRHGVITTAPLGSPTVFEPWKPTASTPSQALAGTFNDLRRRVRVMLEPRTEDQNQDAQPDYRLRVEVMIERREVPVGRMPGASSVSVYANLDEVPEELQRRGIGRGYWQPIARDPHLEQRLMNDMLQRAKHHN